MAVRRASAWIVMVEGMVSTSDADPCTVDPVRVGGSRPGDHAPIAQTAERFHGKEEVKGSIPFGGSLAHFTPPQLRRCCSVGRRLL